MFTRAREQSRRWTSCCAAHFQAEDRDGPLLVHRDVLDDVHGESGFAHAWAGRDHDHLRRDAIHSSSDRDSMKPLERPVRPPCCSYNFSIASIASMTWSFMVRALTFETIFADGVDFLLYFVEQVVDLLLLFVGAARAFRAGADDFAQNVFVADDLEVVADICGGRDEGEKARDKRQRRRPDRAGSDRAALA